MNYYKHHLGDYSKDTAGLTMLEHGAYRLLLDAYYSSESPIPQDEAYAIAKAGSSLEKRAVDKVLTKHFTKDGNCWRQKRVDQELAIYHEKADKNREVGRLGGRPRKNPEITQTVSETKPKRFPNGNPNHNPEETLANNQEPITKKNLKPKTPLPDGFGVSDAVRSWAASEGYGDLDRHLAYFLDYARAHDKRYADWDAALRNAIKGNWAKVSGRPGNPSLPSYT